MPTTSTLEPKHTTPAPAPTTLPSSTIIILSVLVFAAMMMFLNETILAVALPVIMADFSIPATTAQWLTTGFMLTMAVVIPTTGFVLKRWSTRAIFITALSFFIVGTLVAGVAPAFGLLLTGRIIQAVGTALVMPLLMTVAMTLVPPQRRGTIMGIIAVVMAVAPSLGPTASGLILQNHSWHALFWVILPLVSVAMVVGLIFLRNVGEPERLLLDVPSVLLSALAFGGLIYALSSLGSGSASAWIVGAAALVALGFFISRQLKLAPAERALLDLRIFKIRNVVVASVMLLMTFGALMGAVTIMPLYLHNSLGFSERTIGLFLLPGGLLNGLMSPFIGRIYDRVGPRPLLIPGSAMLAVAMGVMTTYNEETSLYFVLTFHILFNVALGLLITPLMTTALAALPSDLYGHGSATLNTLQQLAGAAGTALLIMIFTFGVNSGIASSMPLAMATAHGSHLAFLLATAFAVCGLIASPFIATLMIESEETDVEFTEV